MRPNKLSPARSTSDTPVLSSKMPSSTPKLLDLYCGAGGAAQGYIDAGFDVTGIDIILQPRYPGQFIQDQAIEFLINNWYKFDAIHASPPCQKYSKANQNYLIPNSTDLERLLQFIGFIPLPFVIENVEMAPMPYSIRLTGGMFELAVIRKRHFYSNVLLLQPEMTPQKRSRLPGQTIYTVAGHGNKGNTKNAFSEAMGINWMKRYEIVQSIPPKYTEYIGYQLLSIIS